MKIKGYALAGFKSLFRNIPIAYIFACIMISTILGMAGHDLVTQFLLKPPNTLSQSLGRYYLLATFSIHIVQAFSALILYDLLCRNWKLKNFWIKVIAFALLLAVINENFLRRFLMEIIADHRNIDYEFFMVAVPAYITFAVIALVIVTFNSFCINRWSKIIALIMVALCYQYLEYVIHTFLMSFFQLNAGGQFTQGSYGLEVLIAIYTTYLLPVTGMYVAYLWIRESFPQYGRGLLYFLLLVGVHGQLLGIFQIATSQGNILYRVLYYGSFWWELLIVALTIIFLIERREGNQKSLMTG